MKKRPKQELKCPECDRIFNYPQTLGSHRKFSHGIGGTSISVLSQRRKIERAKAALAVIADPPAPKLGRPKGSKNNQTQRSTSLAIIAQHQTEAQPSSNGHQPQTGAAASLTETAVAVAFGRFQALCDETARQFNVPPTDFTRELARFIHRAHP